MPYLRKYWRWRQPYYKRRQRRYFRTTRWRPRRTFQNKRRRRGVRRKRFYFKNFKKLKQLTVKQFQPNRINKCKIKGYIQLFGAGKGHFSNNFTFYKESTGLSHEPGGGGWSLQQFTLSNLYVQNVYFMNWWTKTNRSLNLCRYLGAKLTLFRQPEVDYIFTYEIEPPYDVTKYFYQSFHPMKLLTYKKKVVVPSFATNPHKKKPYKKIRIRPPKALTNKWYFQQNISNFPLIQFVCTACSLTSMYQSTNAINNAVTLYSLNTQFFQNPVFVANNVALYPKGYQPKENVFMYGLLQPSDIWLDTPIKTIAYLGNMELNDPGDPIGNHQSLETYGYPHWGNPLHYTYLHGDNPIFITSKDPTEMINLAKQNKKLNDIKTYITWKHEPLILECRYNPYYDRGDGNTAFWIPNNVPTKNKYEPSTDPILTIDKFPLWILLWGWEDFTKKIASVHNLDENYNLIVRTKYIDQKQPNHLFLSNSFVHGQGPYEVPGDEMHIQDKAHWYPKWRYQKEAIENILMSGPGVCKSETQRAISAQMKYSFFFKWGGNPATMETIADPTSQPTFAIPNNLQKTNEIIDPTTSISNYIYQWDVRRDMLTQTATNRITDYSTYDQSLFTDGTEDTQEKTSKTPPQTTEKEKEKALLFQLQQQQLLNEQLRNRLLQLKNFMENT
nr:MAG: ORF1 [TTV-like mini virus]